MWRRPLREEGTYPLTTNTLTSPVKSSLKKRDCKRRRKRKARKERRGEEEREKREWRTSYALSRK
jgi:hypothetical protein